MHLFKLHLLSLSLLVLLGVSSLRGQTLIFSERFSELPLSFETTPIYVGSLTSYAFYVNYTDPDTLKNDTTIVEIFSYLDLMRITVDTISTDTFSTISRSSLHYVSVKSLTEHRNFYSLKVSVDGDTGILNPAPGVNVVFDSLVEYNSRESLRFERLLLLPLSTAPLSPVSGEIYFDEIDSTLKVYNGSVWKNCW